MRKVYRELAEVVCSAGNVHVPCQVGRLALVLGLSQCQPLQLLVNQIGNPQQILGSGLVT